MKKLKKFTCCILTTVFALSFLNMRDVLAKTFSDVAASRWSYDAISKLSDDGVISGYEDAAFRPEGNITYAELATMIVKSQNIDVNDKTEAFNHWAGKSVAAYFEISSCPPERYLLSVMNEKMSRAEMAEMVAYCIKDEVVPENKFDDIGALTAEQVSGISKLYSKGIISGMSETRFAPDELVTREQAAMVITKLKYGGDVKDTEEAKEPETAPETPKPQTFKQPKAPAIYNPADTSDIKLNDITGHADEINALVTADIMPGYTDGKWRPERMLSRGEFFYALQRISVSVDGRALLASGRAASFEHFAALEYDFLENVDIVEFGYYDNIINVIDDPITKKEMAIFMCNSYMYSDVNPKYDGYEKIENFSDISNLSKEDNMQIRKAVDLGMIMPKSDTEFGVNDTITREDFAVLLYNL